MNIREELDPCTESINVDSDVHLKAHIDGTVDKYVEHALGHAEEDLTLKTTMVSAKISLSALANWVGQYGYLTKYYILTRKLLAWP